MIRTYLIPLLAIAGVLLAVITVVKGSRPPNAQPPVVEPPRAPFDAFVAGSGLVEASSQNIAVGAPVGAVVTRVLVTVGDPVEAGQPLFELDARALTAQVAVRDAAVAIAARQLARLRAGTRPEEIPPARARIAEAQAALADVQSQLDRSQGLAESGAVSAEELTRRRYAAGGAEARLAEAQGDLALLEAGAWAEDLAIAESRLQEARAQADEVRVEIERRTVRAPVAGRVLQANIRPGEFAQAGTLATPLMMVGAVDPLHVRVDVDEHEAWRVRAGSPAFAYVRGNKDLSTPLAFVRFEPFILPKRSLTGESTERVDTRVLQVLYRFDPGSLPIYVGQQVDVYIEAPPIASPPPADPASLPLETGR